MRVFKSALQITTRHFVYLVVYVGFLSLMGLFITGGLSFENADEDFEAASTSFAVVDRDDSQLSRAVEAFLAEQGEAVSVADEQRALQDAVATGQVEYVLMIPAGFEQDFLEAARTGADEVQLQAVFGYESMVGMLTNTQVNQYLGLVRAAAALQPEADTEVILSAVGQAAQEQAHLETVSSPDAAVGGDQFVFYLMWSSYPLTASIVVSVGLVMGAFNRTDVRRRVAVSARSAVAIGVRKAAAGLVITVAVWAIVMAIGLVAFSESVACLPPQTLAIMLGLELAFVLVPLSIGFLLGQIGASEMVSNAVGNIAGMVFTFLGGAWVSLSLLPAGVRLVSAFTPVYWLTEGLNGCVATGANVSAAMNVALPSAGILVLFAATFFVIALVAGRMRTASTEAGGNAAAARPR